MPPAGIPPLARLSGSADIAQALADLAAVEPTDPVRWRCGTTAPTAAFSRRNTLLPGYADAVEVVRRHGFEPVVRPVGGRLAAYDQGALVIHGWAGDPLARNGILARFRAFGDLLARVLTDAGVPDVRVGSVPGEYCEGEWSLNQGGRHKLVGTGQRVRRNGWLFSAVLTVTDPNAVAAVLIDAYDALGLPLDPSTVGSVSAWVPGATPELLAATLSDVLSDVLNDVLNDVQGDS